MKSLTMLLVLLLGLSIFPLRAQETSTNTLTFNDFSFCYDAAFNWNISITQLGIGDNTIPQTRISFFVPFSEHPEVPAGSIHIYETADIVGDFWSESNSRDLLTLLDERPDLSEFKYTDTLLPFLPRVRGGAQAIRARAHYVETDTVAGIAYLTAYHEGVSLCLNRDFVYTFQGISEDGKRYVSAVFNLTTDLFPAEAPPDFSPGTFDMNAYFETSLQTVNEASPDDFTPSLAVLDEMIESFSFS